MNISNLPAVSAPVAASGGGSTGTLEGQIASLQGQIRSLETDKKTGTKRVEQLEAELRQLEGRVRQKQEREAAARLPPTSESTASQSQADRGSLVDTDA